MNLLLVIVVLCGSLLLGSPVAAFTPTMSGTPCSPGEVSGLDASGLLEKEMPGISHKYSRLVFPPIFRAETWVRPIFTRLSGRVRNTASDWSRSLVGDLGYEDQGILVETMVRAQMSRFSLRGYYDAYLRTYRGAIGTFEWPDFRMGVDFDMVLPRPHESG